MLDFVIFAITFVVALIALVFYLYPGSRKVTTIPGLDPSHTKDGNIPDVIQAGGMHPFLMDLHETYGPIASFWYGEQLAVSLASPELFKEHVKVFDRPAIFFKSLEPLITASSIQFANGTESRKRRKEHDRYFSHSALKMYFDLFTKISDELVKKWSSLAKDQHIPLHQYMMALATKTILYSAFGSDLDDDKIIQLNRIYDVIWTELSDFSTRDSARELRMQEGIDKFRSLVKEVVDSGKKSKTKDDGTFLDFLLEGGFSDDILLADSITYMVGGFHTTGNLLTWAIYFVSTHEDVQERLHKEFVDVLGEEAISSSNLGDLKYARQVIDESLRCSVLAPHAARYQDIDVEIGGHVIPKGTPVLHALGVVLHDAQLWPMPKKFDPDRFNADNTKSRPALSFRPFGFAGQRACPGQSFAYAEVTFYLSVILRKFKLHLVEGQVVNPVYSLVTKPEEEIWITVTPR